MSGSEAAEDVEYKTGVLRAHHRYYITDGDVEIQVNNALFRVHRHFLVRHSPVLNAEKDDLVQLFGDSVAGWECMLGMFYTDDPCQSPRYTAEEWAAVALLANKYRMQGIEEGAIKQIKEAKIPLNMVELLLLAQKLNSKGLYQEAVQSLAKQDRILPFEDAQKIGLGAFYDVIKAQRVQYQLSTIVRKNSVRRSDPTGTFYDGDLLMERQKRQKRA